MTSPFTNNIAGRVKDGNASQQNLNGSRAYIKSHPATDLQWGLSAAAGTNRQRSRARSVRRTRRALIISICTDMRVPRTFLIHSGMLQDNGEPEKPRERTDGFACITEQHIGGGFIDTAT